MTQQGEQQGGGAGEEEWTDDCLTFQIIEKEEEKILEGLHGPAAGLHRSKL